MPETRAAISSLYQEAGVHFTVDNTGDDVWDNGLVAYQLTVTRDGTLVQTDSQAMNGIAPGAQFTHRVDFLGAEVSGQYTLQLVVVDQVTGAALATETFVYDHHAAGEAAPDPAAGAPRVASVTSLYKDGNIFFEVVNGGATTWNAGDVSWQLEVTRAGTVVQSTQEELSGVPPQGSFGKEVQFLAPGVPGTYTMDLRIFDLHSGERIGAMVGDFDEQAR
jgi:hypothetical protein